MPTAKTASEDPAQSRLMADIDYAGRQIVGDRAGQEDTYGVVPPEELGSTSGRDLLAILADGMGGHVAGEVASSLAVDCFAQTFLDSPMTDDAQRLWQALEAANNRIGEKIEASGGRLDGMGSTLVAFVLRGRSLRWISVGDSPLYLVSGGEIRRLNRLHSLVGDIAEKVRQGRLTPQEGENAISKVNKNTLTAALIGGTLYSVDDPEAIEVRPGDVVLATSDGVDTVEPAELAEIVSAGGARSAAAIAEDILDAVKAKNRPAQDNATVVVARVPPESAKP